MPGLAGDLGVALDTKRFIAVCAALFLSGAASTAWATPITINPGDFPFGTDLSTIFSGVTLSHVKNAPNTDGVDGRQVFRPVASAVYAIPTHHTAGGLSIGGFGMELNDYRDCRNAGANGLLFGCSSYDVLDVSFDKPTGFLEVRSIFFSDGPSILAYDLAGNQIAFALGEYVVATTALDPDNSSSASTIMLKRSQADISKIVFGGNGGNSTPVEITYKVAEPATMGLMLLGVAGAAAFRRRRRQ